MLRQGHTMAILEHWQKLQDLAAKKPPASELFEAFLAWSETFTAASEDHEALFVAWRLLDSGERRRLLQQAIADKIPAVGNGPQLELGVLVALYRFLEGRRCYIVTPFYIVSPVVRSVEKVLSALPGVTVRSAGFMCGNSQLKLSDCLEAAIVMIDYYVLAAAYRGKRELLAPPVALFLLELDMCLYHNRLLFYERSAPKAAGMIFKATSAEPFDKEDEKQKPIFDVLGNLAKQGLRCGGVLSRISPFVAGELDKWGRGALLPKAIKPSKSPSYSAFTYRSDKERSAALAQDIMKSPHNALVVGFSETAIKALQEELRRSGQDCTSSNKTTDIPTFFTMAGGPKRVMLFRGMPSTLISRTVERPPGALYIAEHFLCFDHHLKVLSACERVLDLQQPMRLFFSLEDPLFAMYSEEAGFSRLFDIIDFTERYDPWRQIRRVLAKAMISKVQRLREHSLHEDSPLVTTTLVSPTAIIVPEKNKGARHAARMDAPCFCGSGKPFKECHGRPKSAAAKPRRK
jgi:hypothetical protein